jgi:hypothetical protein
MDFKIDRQLHRSELPYPRLVSYRLDGVHKVIATAGESAIDAVMRHACERFGYAKGYSTHDGWASKYATCWLADFTTDSGFFTGQRALEIFSESGCETDLSE